MCTLAFQGYGYSQGFVENYKKIASKVISDPNTKIEVVDNLDTICNPSYGLVDKERHRNRRLFGLHGVGNQNRKNMN